MTWNLFIDDERFPPNDGREWIIARNFAKATSLVLSKGFPSYISFDHDLGNNELTGYDIVKFLIEMDMDDRNSKWKFPDDFDFYVHSQNPIGKQNIESYLNNYLKYKGK